MAAPTDDANSFWPVAGLVGAAIVGSVTKCPQWIDARTGRFSTLLMLSGMAVSLVLASIVHWVGIEKGIDAWTQIMVTGVGCYMGPDMIIRAVFNGFVLKRVGVDPNAGDTENEKR